MRVSAVLAYAAAAVLSVWTAGLPSGVPLPVPGLVGLAWTLIGLLWLRVVALWIGRSQGTYFWLSSGEPDRGRPVSLTKGAAGVRRNRFGALLRRVRTYRYDDAPWVYLRQSVVWLLLPVSFVALVVLGDSHGSPHVRSLVRAGAAYETASVAEVVELTERRSDEGVTGYRSTLVLALPGGARVRAEGAATRYEPKPDSRVPVLWAPTAPGLGGMVDDGEGLGRYLDRDWGPTWRTSAYGALVLLLVLVAILPASIAAEDEGIQDMAWSPLAQTVHAGVVTGAVLAALPFLTGTASGHDVAMIGAACVSLPALYLAMPIRTLL
ncbi:hypothetical protein [Streptomyces sp. NPDC047014]|uniref:hypothetical protein n=1 Tax=Streptomyces sp. NPDC047014 TaxID=3155736 RepID=UPI00340CF893